MEKGYHQYYPKPGPPTPWGRAQSKTVFAKGIVFYSTSGHGGIKVNKALNAKIPEALRTPKGWYEEDSEACIPILCFPQAFPGKDIESARKTVKDIWPDEYAKAFGVEVKPEESRTLRQRLFNEAHRNDYVVTAAYGEWQPGVPKKHVGVVARIGGWSGDKDADKYFLVPKDEYDKRGEFGFVIDPARHIETEDFTQLTKAEVAA